MPRKSGAELRFPYQGLNEAFSYHGQRPDTSVDLKNVRAYDPTTGRSRGGKRSGLSTYLSAAHPSGGPFQCLFAAVKAKEAAYSSTVLEPREFKRIGIASGGFRTFTTSAWATPTGSVTIDSNAPIIQACQLFGVVYFVDGSNYNKYTLSSDTLATWSASAGTLPTNGGYEARLITVWRGRVVMSGIPTDPSNWYMTAVGDPGDIDYTATVTETIAVAGDNAEAGKTSDAITCLIDYSDDILIFGCDHSIQQMVDDPMSGGRISMITDTVGIAFGSPWCRDPMGNIYFFGSRGGIYRMAPGSMPERITSLTIDERLAKTDMKDQVISCAWDDRTQGCHFFVTPLTAAATTHYFYDARNEAWFIDSFVDTNHDPTAVVLFDGDDPEDRAVLLGCRDGKVREFDLAAKDDDGEEIDSYVVVGPIKQQGGSSQQLTEILFVMDDDSDPVDISVYAGNSEEHALNKDPVYTTEIGPGRNPIIRPRCRGHALYIKIAQSDPDTQWAFEYAVVGLDVYDGLGARVYTT